jgi:uncharacterized membrane protein YczE
MFKPVRWKTLPRDFAVIQVGFAMFGLSIAMLIRAHLGTSSWAVLEVALAGLIGLSVGAWSILIGLGVLVIALALREQVGWGTLGNIIFIGVWLDVFLWLIPDVTGAWVVQGAMLLGAVAVMGVATAIYIGVDAGAGPRDSLMLAIHRTTGVSVRVARGSIELAVVLVGWLLGGPLGIGTVIFAALIGPAVQASFRLFGVKMRVTEKAAAD